MYRLKELKRFLYSCHYPQELLDHAINTALQRDPNEIQFRKTDIIPLVLTHNPNHAIDFNYVKTRINNVESPRLERAIKKQSHFINQETCKFERSTHKSRI